MVYPTDDVGFVGPHNWFPNTGAMNHATLDGSMMSSTTSYNGLDALRVRNSLGFPIVGIDHANLTTKSRNLKLSNVLHVPSLSASLLSVQRFGSDNNVFF